MPGAVLERPKLTKSMYQVLKKHIMKEREKKKQELEQDAQIERMKKEQEMRKKKEKEDSLTLEQTKEQIQQLEKKLEGLKAEKHELFSQLKKVLHQEDETRKRAQIKEQQSDMMNIQQAYPTHIPVSSHNMLTMQTVSGRPTLYRPQQPMIPVSHQMTIKRPHSPSPPPSSVYQQYPDSKMMQPSAPKYPHHSQPAEYKSNTYPGHTQASQVTYTSKPAGHAYQTPAGIYSGTKSPGKSYPTSQSAFTSYSNHFAHQQQKQLQEGYAGYPRMQQPSGYMAPSHGSLQQQLEHANQKAGFNDENKYKMQQQQQIRPIAGQAPQGMMHPQIQLQQPPQKGSIVTGYSARGQAPQQSTATPQNYPPQQSQVRQLTGQPMTGQPMTGQPMTAQPMTGQPMTGQPMTGQPMTAQQMGGQHPSRPPYY